MIKRLIFRLIGRKDLTKILGLFDKAQKEINDYIVRTEKTEESLKANLAQVQINIDTAKVAQGVLTKLTSAPN